MQPNLPETVFVGKYGVVAVFEKASCYVTAGNRGVRFWFLSRITKMFPRSCGYEEAVIQI